MMRNMEIPTMIFLLLFSCNNSEPEDTNTMELVCVDWVDSCSGCTWMCTDESEKPDVVCDIECTEPPPEGECVPTEANTCAFQ